ncbi:DUF4183 domain-containing protein [Brevibacillus brevis]|uniref:DUF4183 domain-containing protein n=1 Tax=Brevibacillus brevis TaxID=1393 RepID=UPI0025A62A9C|nr:DUF4183 domain-containing protein [Brevibacillus brevis]WJQ80516.1 DUF4183 domain-containing protein [Brevibacillus brevis]
MRRYVTQSYTVRRQCLQIVQPLGCPGIFPVKPSPTCPPCPPCPCTPGIIRTETYQYTAISDGVKNVYTNSDAVMPFSTSGILDPNEVSVVNLFINGMLQPPNLYVVQPGVLILSDIPVQGVPLIVQFIKMILS